MSPPPIRASDAEREGAVVILRDACGEGRLTLEEFSDRVEEAYTAATLDDLARIVADLPGELPARPVPERPKRRYVIGILGSGARRGRWQLGESTVVLAVLGGCELDLRRAVMEGPTARILAIGSLGSVRITVPDHIAVTVSGSGLLGSVEERVHRSGPMDRNLPTVHIRAIGVLGSVEIRRAKPRAIDRLRGRLRR